MLQYDVAVLGGSLCGCMAALEAAKNGAKVVLAETGTFLGNEFTQTLRPWVSSNNCENADPDLIGALFNNSTDINVNKRINKEIPLFMGEIKKNLLKMLLDNDVTVLFMCEAAGIVVEDNKASGVLLGTKNGLKLFFAKAVVDATENRRAAWFAGAARKVRSGDVITRRTMEYFDIKEPAQMCIAVPENIGIHENTIILHQGKYKKDQYFIDFAVKYKVSAGTFKERMSMEVDVRKKSILLAEYLKKNIPEFAEALLQQSSYQLYFPPVHYIEDAIKVNKEILEIQGCKNLFTLNSEVNLGANPDLNEVNSYVNSAKSAGYIAAKSILDHDNSNKSGRCFICLGDQKIELDRKLLKEDKNEFIGLKLFSVDQELLKSIPVKENYDIVVSGGGTGGVPAALASAGAGAKVALIENFWGLGGTKTIGGIANYYHGYRGGFSEALDKKVLSMCERVTGKVGTGHMESKMMTMVNEVDSKGISLFMGTKVIGAVMDEKSLKGVITASPDGIGVISCSMAVDATGDGDLAAFAGAGYSYGSPRDESVQTFNHNGFTRGTVYDIGVVDCRKLYDVMRCLYFGHANADRYDFCPMLAVRESRRIDGDYMINISDVIFKKKFYDVISTAMTDCDPHGVNSSWIARLGYLPLRDHDKYSSIPYRACLPKGIEGLLVTAKAISATRDAANFLRMSADIQNLGYAAGTAAALAHKHGVMPRYINIKELQAILLKEDIINENVLIKEPQKKESEENFINAAAEGDEEAFLKLICCKKEVVFESLKVKYKTCPENLMLAKALAWFGSDMGVDVLVNELARLWEKEDGRFHIDLHPVHADGTVLSGFLNKPDIYWGINQLIVLLGLAGNKAAIDLICTIASAAEAGGQQYIIPQAYTYGKVRIDWARVPHYDRIMSIAFSLERLADHKAIPSLESLIDRPYIGGYVSRQQFHAGENYLSAYLELCVARTLARCGSVKGALILAGYIEDVQSVLSEHSYQELKVITGRDYGKNSSEWRKWLKSQDILAAKPFVEVFYEPIQ